MKIVMVQQNLNREFKENEEYTEKIIDELLYIKKYNIEMPHVLLLSEFCYACQSDGIIDRLENLGYKVFLPSVPPKTEKKYQRYDGFDCICMMAIKSELDFDPDTRKQLDKDDLRYIEGTILTKSGKSVKIFFAHIPWAETGGERLGYKKQMLEAATCFWQENKDEITFVGGDFNTEANGKGTTTLESLFMKLYEDEDISDSDQDKNEPTWRNKRLDYALVSNSLVNLNCVTKHLSTISDHAALITVFDLE